MLYIFFTLIFYIDQISYSKQQKHCNSKRTNNFKFTRKEKQKKSETKSRLLKNLHE